MSADKSAEAFGGRKRGKREKGKQKGKKESIPNIFSLQALADNFSLFLFFPLP
jgi:hypothetical protein